MTKAEARKFLKMKRIGDVHAAARKALQFSEKARTVRRTMRVARAEKRQTKGAETAEIREACVKRADGVCELCGGPSPAELHHLEGGSGRRVQQQAVSNCMWICAFCHREYHRDAEQFRGIIESWCREHDHPVPARFRRAA